MGSKLSMATRKLCNPGAGGFTSLHYSSFYCKMQILAACTSWGVAKISGVRQYKQEFVTMLGAQQVFNKHLLLLIALQVRMRRSRKKRAWTWPHPYFDFNLSLDPHSREGLLYNQCGCHRCRAWVRSRQHLVKRPTSASCSEALSPAALFLSA